MESTGLDTLWEALSRGLPPETERILIRLIKAHVHFLSELVKVAEKTA